MNWAVILTAQRSDSSKSFAEETNWWIFKAQDISCLTEALFDQLLQPALHQNHHYHLLSFCGEIKYFQLLMYLIRKHNEQNRIPIV